MMVVFCNKTYVLLQYRSNTCSCLLGHTSFTIKLTIDDAPNLKPRYSIEGELPSLRMRIEKQQVCHLKYKIHHF